MRKRTLSLMLAAVLTIGLALPTANVEAASKVKISSKKITLTVGEKKTLTVKQGSKKVKGVKWKTSNKKIATVTSGKVTAKKAGKATITATANKKNYTCKVTVKAKEKQVTTETPTSTEQQTTPTTTEQQTIPTTTEQQTTPTTTEQQTTPTTTEQQTAPSTTEQQSDPTTTEETVSDQVEWDTVEETYEGSFSQVNEETGETENFPIQLLRKYVSFNPWPTTDEQVQYVIKNCDDPYVIAALYIVALDNYTYGSRGDYSGVTYKMLESLQTGAGAITGSNYLLNNYDKAHINEFGTKYCEVQGGENVLASSFASRTFLKGATPYNGYTPEGGLEDKTKWQIIVDQYPYCFDQENEVKKYITLCPRRYTEYQDTENGPLVPVEHSQVLRIGFRWNGSKRVWLPTDNVTINTDPGSSALVPYNIKASILFSNDYKAPQVDQGW